MKSCWWGGARLSLRLGADHPVVRRYNDAHDALVGLGVTLNEYGRGAELTPAHDVALSNAREAFVRSNRKYLDEGKALVSPEAAGVLRAG